MICTISYGETSFMSIGSKIHLYKSYTTETRPDKTAETATLWMTA